MSTGLTEPSSFLRLAHRSRIDFPSVIACVRGEFYFRAVGRSHRSRHRTVRLTLIQNRASGGERRLASNIVVRLRRDFREGSGTRG